MVKISKYEIDDELIMRYYRIIKAIYHDGGNNFSEYGRRRVKVHKEILKSARFKDVDRWENEDCIKFNVELDIYLQELFRKDDYK